MKSNLANLKISAFTFISRILSGSIIYIVLARFLSITDFGLLSFGTTLAALITVISEFGYSLMAQRDIPQNKIGFKEYVYNGFLQKTGYSLLALILGFIYILSSYTEDNLTVGLIFIITAVLTSNSMYLFSIFRARNIFKAESSSAFLYSILLIILIALYFMFGLNIIDLSCGILIARAIQLGFLTLIFFKKFGSPGRKYDSKLQNYFFKNSFSFGTHYIIGIFYLTIDNQILVYYTGNEALAIYQAIFKIVFILLSFADLITNVFLPYMSSIYSKNLNEFKKVVGITNLLAVFVAVILFLFFNFFSFTIVKELYTDKYLVALTIAIPLSFVLMLRVISSIFGIVLTISNHQNIRVVIVFVSLIFNVILNFIIIPKFSYVGAAWVSFGTHLLLFILYSFAVKKFLGSYIITLKSVAIIAVSSGMIYLFYNMGLENSIGLSIIFFSLSLILVGLFITKQDYFAVRNIFREKY